MEAAALLVVWRVRARSFLNRQIMGYCSNGIIPNIHTTRFASSMVSRKGYRIGTILPKKRFFFKFFPKMYSNQGLFDFVASFVIP